MGAKLEKIVSFADMFNYLYQLHEKNNSKSMFVQPYSECLFE